jgi:hypothetical protein
VELSDVLGGRIDTITAWRQNGGAGTGGLTLNTRIGDLTISGITLFGNPSNTGTQSGATMTGPILIRNGVFAGDTTFSSATGFAFPGAVGGQWGQRQIFENCTFGVVSGIFTAHTTADIDFTANTPRYVQLVLRNTLLASATEFANRTAILTSRAYIADQKQDQVANDHQIDYPALGIVSREATIFHTDAPSEKMAPNGATTGQRLRSAIKRIPVASTKALSVSVWVRKSAAYTGSTVRLIALSNYPMGILDDTVVDSMTAAADTWEQLTGTLPTATADGVVELCVECDGSAGLVYVDDWAAAVA